MKNPIVMPILVVCLSLKIGILNSPRKYNHYCSQNEVMNEKDLLFNGKLNRYFSLNKFKKVFGMADSIKLMAEEQPCSYIFENKDGSKNIDDKYLYKNGSRFEITKIHVDAIVNAANTSLLGGGGVDGAIHRTGGKEILEDCRKIIAKQGGCKIGEAAITTAGKLPAKFVIHTVGPVWNNGLKNEEANLTNCYLNSLKMAVDNQCKSISFPAISTGIYKFPKAIAAKIAVETIANFLADNHQIEKVILVSFDEENYQIIQSELNKQQSK